MVLPVWMLFALVGVTIAIPILYIFVTWDHDMTASYAALPAPSDLGTKEFRWRCYLSPMTRNGWRHAILRAPCPRITLQSPFALLSTDFAKMTTSLGFQELHLETIPFIFPQVAISGLFIQLLGNSNFPAALTGLKIKAITICQLRPLDMRFRDKELEDVNGEKKRDDDGEIDGLNCLMVLTEKRFLETEVEFVIQTDLFDEQGTVWQSTTCISVPFKQDKLLTPLSASAAQLDAAAVADREFTDPESVEFACSPRNLDELEEVSVTNLDGSETRRAMTPAVWLVGRMASALQHQKRVPRLPILCAFVLSDEATKVPIQSRVTCASTVSHGSKPTDKMITQVAVTHGSSNVVSGVLRTVGWVYEADPSNPSN